MAYSYPLPKQSESDKVATICRQIVKDMVTDVVGYIPELQQDWRGMGVHITIAPPKNFLGVKEWGFCENHFKKWDFLGYLHLDATRR